MRHVKKKGARQTNLFFLFVYIVLETSFAVIDNLSARIKKSNTETYQLYV